MTMKLSTRLGQESFKGLTGFGGENFLKNLSKLQSRV